MLQLDFRPIVALARETVNNHALETPGTYARWLWQAEGEDPRELGVNPYGCADACNILYTIGEFSCDEAIRQARIRALQNMQDPATGLFYESTHHPFHTTAHCTAALQLFDARPLYPLTAMHQYFDKDTLYNLLDGLQWKTRPWPESHIGAGVYAALVNAGEITQAFADNYFAWFWENASPDYGFWSAGTIENAAFSKEYTVDGTASMFQFMGGGFHYMFNHEYAHRPYRYPEKIVDTCIKLYKDDFLPPTFGTRADFLEADWVYSLNRALRQCRHRYAEAKALTEDFAEKYLASLQSLDLAMDDRFNDLHFLFGLLCCVAELQAALPGQILTEQPLHLVLDRRPFI